jgi:hypothetical protein
MPLKAATPTTWATTVESLGHSVAWFDLLPAAWVFEKAFCDLSCQRDSVDSIVVSNA